MQSKRLNKNVIVIEIYGSAENVRIWGIFAVTLANLMAAMMVCVVFSMVGMKLWCDCDVVVECNVLVC